MVAFQSDSTFDYCLVVLADARFTESAGPAARTVGTSVFRANRGYALMCAVQSCTLVDCQAIVVVNFQSVATIVIDTARALRAGVGVADRIYALRGTDYVDAGRRREVVTTSIGQTTCLRGLAGDAQLVTEITARDMQRGWFTQADGSPDGNLLLVSIGRSVAGRLTTQIVEIDVTTGAVREVTTLGGWAEFQWPRFSPSETRVAYQQRFSQPTGSIVVVDGKAVYHCKTASSRCVPQWIDNRSLVILDAGSDEKALVVVNVDSGEVKGRYRFDPPQ